MRTFPLRHPQPPRHVHARPGARATTLRRVLLVLCAALFEAPFLFGVALSAQTHAAPAPAPTQPAARSSAKPTTHGTAKLAAHSRVHKRRKAPPAKPAAQAAPAPAPAVAAPAAPPAPNWPANKKPVEATVVWDSHGLLIQASNSSLDQILKDVSLRTGIKVEGMGTDERVFGTYGPGLARDVLAQLLDGSGYNILMVGDQGAGTPRKVVLSGRPTGPAPPPPPGNANSVASNDNDSENDQDSEPRPFEPNPAMPPVPGAAPGMPVRTPQQMMEERQRDLQQQQQNNPQDTQN